MHVRFWVRFPRPPERDLCIPWLPSVCYPLKYSSLAVARSLDWCLFGTSLWLASARRWLENSISSSVQRQKGFCADETRFSSFGEEKITVTRSQKKPVRLVSQLAPRHELVSACCLGDSVNCTVWAYWTKKSVPNVKWRWQRFWLSSVRGWSLITHRFGFWRFA